MPIMPLIVPSAPGVVIGGITLEDYLLDLARSLGTHLRTTASQRRPSGETGRWLVVDETLDADDLRDRFSGGYATMKNGLLGGTARRIRETGYEGPSGALAMTRVFSRTVGGSVVPTTPEPGAVVDLTEPLPLRAVSTVAGLDRFVNQALERIRIPVRLPLSGNGTTRYALSDYREITSLSQTDGLYDRRPGTASDETAASRSARGYDLTVDGAAVTLETAIAYGEDEPFELACLLEASHVVDDGTGWGYVGNGLVQDNDQAAVPLRWVTTGAMVLALEYLLRENERDRTADEPTKGHRRAELSHRLESRWAPAWQRIVQTRLPRRSADPVREFVSVLGPRGGGPASGSRAWWGGGPSGWGGS
jgi:hypothetical protein